MTLNETLKQLKALGNAKVRAQNAKGGAGDDQFAVSLGDIRVLARRIRTNHELALSGTHRRDLVITGVGLLAIAAIRRAAGGRARQTGPLN